MEQPRNSRIAEDRCGVVVGAARVEGMLQVEAPVVDRDVGARARVPDPAEATCGPAVPGIADAEAQCGVDDEAAGLKRSCKSNRVYAKRRGRDSGQDKPARKPLSPHPPFHFCCLLVPRPALTL